MKRLVIACVVSLCFVPMRAGAGSADIQWQHSCQDSPPPASDPNQVVSGFAGFKIYQSATQNGQYDLSDTVPGCIKMRTVTMKHLPTSWFRVRAFDNAGNESDPSSPSMSKTIPPVAHLSPP